MTMKNGRRKFSGEEKMAILRRADCGQSEIHSLSYRLLTVERTPLDTLTVPARRAVVNSRNDCKQQEPPYLRWLHAVEVGVTGHQLKFLPHRSAIGGWKRGRRLLHDKRQQPVE